MRRFLSTPTCALPFSAVIAIAVVIAVAVAVTTLVFIADSHTSSPSVPDESRSARPWRHDNTEPCRYFGFRGGKGGRSPGKSTDRMLGEQVDR